MKLLKRTKEDTIIKFVDTKGMDFKRLFIDDTPSLRHKSQEEKHTTTKCVTVIQALRLNEESMLVELEFVKIQ
jgi:hypothetical protein